jgi:hypothetical protein
MTFPAHRAGLPGHASGEQNVSKGSFVSIVPSTPPISLWQKGHVPVEIQNPTQSLFGHW